MHSVNGACLLRLAVDWVGCGPERLDDSWYVLAVQLRCAEGIALRAASAPTEMSVVINRPVCRAVRIGAEHADAMRSAACLRRRP